MASPTTSLKKIAFNLHNSQSTVVQPKLEPGVENAAPPISSLLNLNSDIVVSRASGQVKSPTPSPAEKGKSKPETMFDRRSNMDSVYKKEVTTTPSEAARMAQSIRDKSSSICHTHVRSLKYDVAKFREHLLKVEEEVKRLNKGKRTLELLVQDIRKDISANQQSYSLQQKRTRNGDDLCIKTLEAEKQTLSKCKQSTESYLQTMRAHLLALDGVRKSLQGKVTALSQGLELDAQNFRICHNPHLPATASSDCYQSRCPQSKEALNDKDSEGLCSRAMEALSGSSGLIAGINGVIDMVQSSKSEAQRKVASAIAAKVAEADRQKTDLVLEKGQIRLVQNATSHQCHIEEIALGTLLGPVSEKHRSVSEKPDCPLSRVRPATVCEERTEFRESTAKLTRQLSAASVRTADLIKHDHVVTKKLKESAKDVLYDTDTLRIRRIPLQNRSIK